MLGEIKQRMSLLDYVTDPAFLVDSTDKLLLIELLDFQDKS